MTQTKISKNMEPPLDIGIKPTLKISKLGIVSRDYSHKFSNGCSDYSHVLSKVLIILDAQECDAVMFSLYSIIPNKAFDLQSCLKELKHVKAVFVEEYEYECDGCKWNSLGFVVHYRIGSHWEEYKIAQKFGTLKGYNSEIKTYAKTEMPKRILGNCCVLLCGEINGVKYSRADKNIHDSFGLRQSIPQDCPIILNPSHDRMIRFEMNIKRKFLSENNRWVISVWNKGKIFGDKGTRDGLKPAWSVWNDGNHIDIPCIPNELGVEIGLVSLA